MFLKDQGKIISPLFFQVCLKYCLWYCVSNPDSISLWLGSKNSQLLQKFSLVSFYDLKPPPLNAGQGCDCFFCATHDTSETIWSSSWWRTATWTRRRTPTSSPRTLSGRHIIPFSIQEKSNKMNTLLDKQYCHCCPNKSLNKKSKSLFQLGNS